MEGQWAADVVKAELVDKCLLLFCATRMLEEGMGCHDIRKEKRRYWFRRTVGMDGMERWMMGKEVGDERESQKGLDKFAQCQ